MRAKFSRRLKYALGIVILSMSIPVVSLAQGLVPADDWGSPVAETSLSLSATPGGTVGGWAGMSVRWEAGNSDESDNGAALDVDTEATTVPGPLAVSTLALRLPSLDGGEYVWEAYRINFQAPDAPGEYQYTLKWSSGESSGGNSADMPDLTVNLKVG